MRNYLLLGLTALTLATAPASATPVLKPSYQQIELSPIEKAIVAGERLMNRAETFEEYLGGQTVFTLFTILQQEQEGQISYYEASTMVKELGNLNANRETIEPLLDGKGNNNLPEIKESFGNSTILCQGYALIIKGAYGNRKTFATELSESTILKQILSDAAHCGNQQ